MLAFSSLVLSLAALLVAGFSVYAVSLRHANIEVYVTKAEIASSGMTGHVPSSSVLLLTLLASNDGARSGLLEAIRVPEVKANVDLWGIPLGTGTLGPEPFPMVLQANEAHSFAWSFAMVTEVSEDAAAFEEFVSRVERLTSVEVVVQWWYHRSSGLPFAATVLPEWLRRGRRRESRELTEPIDAFRYRAGLARVWRDQGRAELADRVEPWT
jgi:hypothetical protein